MRGNRDDSAANLRSKARRPPLQLEPSFDRRPLHRGHGLVAHRTTMANFDALLNRLNKMAADRDATCAVESCPKKNKPAIFVIVARSNDASALSGVSVEISGSTSAKKTTGGDGLAKFDPVKAGNHTIKLVLTDEQKKKFTEPAPGKVIVPMGWSETQLLVVDPKPNLEVTVVLKKPDGTKPLDGISIDLAGQQQVTSTKPKGLAKFEYLKPGTYKVQAKLTADQAKEYFAPPPQTVVIEAGKDAKLTVELLPAEANTVKITKLPRWFLPTIEACDLGYELAGRKATADRLALEVYASNHVELDQWNDGLPTFRPLPDVPVYTRPLVGKNVEEKAAVTLTDWKGETNCIKGVLASKDGVARTLNVALSPYTVVFRYHRADADGRALVELTPFWPAFAPDGTAVADSLKIKYKVRNTTKLQLGKLVVWDGTDTEIYAKDLVAADLTDGDHTIAWDGKKTGGAAIDAAGAPYRVQIQAHTPKGEANALALAVMQTEIRLYVHPQTHAVDLDPYVADTDASSLAFGLADLHHKDTAPTRAADGKLWTKLQLAEAGYHAGPVRDAAVTDPFKLALADFQRSVPRHKNPAAAPYERLAISTDGTDDDKTKEALANLPAARRRPWFGKSADRSDYDHTTDAFRNDLRDPSKTLVVWVDDRWWYSDPHWLNPPIDDVSPTIRSVVTSHPSALGNTRGAYTDNGTPDAKATYDLRDGLRPWIPLQVEFRLLKSTDKLTDILTGALTDKEIEAMREAVGPLRVDWSFDEIDGTAIRVPEVDTSLYHKERCRTKSALESALDQLKTAAYARKDVKRQATYFNCPVAQGGIRPAGAAGYYKAAFGLDDTSLLPWKTADDGTRETIVTVAHGRLGQPADQVFPKRRLGRAGVHFTPSQIAGDGYRVRAQVWFADHASFKLPNHAVLKQRYARPPQAHTAALRVWRKGSIRAYVSWSNNNNWAATTSDMKRFYTCAHVHLVNELGIGDGAVPVPIGAFWNAASSGELAAYRAVIKECVKSTASGPFGIFGGQTPRRVNDNITLNADKFWPWADHDALGVPEVTPLNPADPWGAVWTLLKDIPDPLFYKLSVRMGSELARQVESKLGRMRGYIIVEMRVTGDIHYRKYKCDSAACGGIAFGLERTAATTAHAGQKCTCGGGRLQVEAYVDFHYHCPNGHVNTYEDDKFNGGNIPAACPSCGQPQTYNNSTVGTVRSVLYTDDMPVPSIGNPVGVSFDKHAGYELWGHELGHNRYMEHAVNAGGANDAQHDAVANPVFAGSTEPAVSARWDRTCLMAYTNQIDGYLAAKDKQCFCFRCVLKQRGWKLAGVPDPVAGTQDP